MSVEVDLLVQEAKESIEAAQNYRSELQQRLQGLSQARKQVCAAATAPQTSHRPCSHLRALRSFCNTPPAPPQQQSKQCCYFLFLQPNLKWRK